MLFRSIATHCPSRVRPRLIDEALRLLRRDDAEDVDRVRPRPRPRVETGRGGAGVGTRGRAAVVDVVDGRVGDGTVAGMEAVRGSPEESSHDPAGSRGS